MAEASGRPVGLAVATAALVLVSSAVALAVFGSAGHDDSHITYWAAASMCEHGLPVNYNGDRVEQSSTPAFTALLAAMACVLPVPLPILGTGPPCSDAR